MIFRNQKELGRFTIDNASLAQLIDLHQILTFPHVVQELLSAQKTPTVSQTLPTYGLLISKWKGLARRMTYASDALNKGIDKIQHYVHASKENKVFILAICTCP